MAIDTGSTDVGGRPGTSLTQLGNGNAEFKEIRENGTEKVTSVWPDGTIHRHIERTDPQTGITTTIERHADGRLEKIIEWPGGQKQSTTDWPDGHRESYRIFKGPDGTDWTQTVDKQNRFQTTHDTVDPDGTHRHVVKTFDGKVEVTTTKTTMQEDGSTMTQIKSPNGDITTKVEWPDGNSHHSTMHPDGTDEVVAVFREPDGTIVTRTVGRDGSESVDRRWLTPDGHEHRELREVDGSIKKWENWEDVLSDGTRVTHTNTPWANETTTNHPNGSYETVKNHSDGTTSHFSHRENPDGSIDEFHTRRDGKVMESHYQQNPDGSYTTKTNDYNGVERTTMVGRDGRVEIDTHHADGTRAHTSYSSDGSGRTDFLDENGRIDGYTDIMPDPAPMPGRGYSDPDEFIKPALRELPESVGAPTPEEVAEAGDFGAIPLTENQQDLLEAHGISVPGSIEDQGDWGDAPGSVDMEQIGGTADDLEIGHTPGGKIVQEGTEGTIAWERLPDGTLKWTGVRPDGATFKSAQRTDPATGITTEVKRNRHGDVKTTIESPDGTSQVTVRHPDGTEEITRTFKGPDGSDWSQTTGKDGVRTIHRTFEPDGTIRHVEKLPDGKIEVTTTKGTQLPDGNHILEINTPNGDVTKILTRPDGDAEMTVIHPDQSRTFSTIKTDAEGVKVRTDTAEDGSVSVTREWTEQDGTSVRTFTHPDGRVDEWRTYEFTQNDKSVIHVEESPEGSVETITFPNGSIMKETQHSDGRIDKWSFRKNPDGSAVERELLHDGSTRETTYSTQGLDGTYTNVARGFDGSTTTTTLERNGLMGVQKVNADGSSTWTRYETDGSGRTTMFDMNGNQISESAIMPIPAPHPRNYQPEHFLEDARRELPESPADVRMEQMEAENEFGAIGLSEDQQEFLEEHGAEISSAFSEDEMAGVQPEGVPEVASGTPGDEEVAFAAPGGEAIGAAGKRHFGTHQDGIRLQEELIVPEGAKSERWLAPDGTTTSRVDWTNPSTGIHSEVVREKNGDVRTTVDAPTGEQQITIRHPDGSVEVQREFRGPDGSGWRQVTTKDGTRTTHQTVDPDGTIRRVVKTEDGRTLETTTKTTEMPDHSQVTVVHDPSGDVYTMTSRPDGTGEHRVDHPNGTSAVTTVTKDAEGAKVFTARSEDGSITTTREWSAPDGVHRTVTWPDGHTDQWRTIEYTNKEGATVHVEESPTGVVATTTWPNGNVERETQHAGGGVDTYSFTKHGRTAIERETLADGSTRETRILDQGEDGNFTTIAKGFDGVETISGMQRDGSMSIRKLNPSGSITETSYKADGSGHTKIFDAQGQLISNASIAELPRPSPGDFHPEQFLADAQRELPGPELQTEPGSTTFTDAELQRLDERGIAGPDRAARLDEETENGDHEPLIVPVEGELKMPVGALGAERVVKDYEPPEPRSVRFTDYETESGTIRIHGVGDDVLYLDENGDEYLVIHNVGPEPTLQPEASEGESPFGGEDTSEVVDPVAEEESSDLVDPLPEDEPLEPADPYSTPDY